MKANKFFFKDWLVALSLANLCFLQAWRSIIDPASLFYYYHWKRFPGWIALSAITVNVLATALIFWLCANLARRSRRDSVRRLADALFLLAVLFSLNSIRLQVDSLLVPNLLGSLGKVGLVILLLSLCALGLFALRRFSLRQMSRAARAFVLILSPLLLFNFAQAVWLTFKYKSMLHDKPLAGALPASGTPARRVLWLVFDEMDERIAFPKSSGLVSLPEFERLRAESIYATNAFPPAGETLLSMPAYITGRLVSKAKQVQPDELHLDFSDGTKGAWSRQPNIFSEARAAGYNTALTGWYHPYCRIFNESLTSCSWQSMTAITRPALLTVSQHMLFQIRALALSLPLWQRYHWARKIDNAIFRTRDRRNLKRSRIATYEVIREESLSLVARPEFGLTMIHLSVPHPPGIYDRRKGVYSTELRSSYLDNLALADRMFGELRRTMESAQLWDATTVVVTSDHWLRYEDLKMLLGPLGDEDLALLDGKKSYRIPFILKLAGQKEGVAYDAKFNTVITHDLVLALLRGELGQPPEVVRWLDERRAIGATLYEDSEGESK